MTRPVLTLAAGSALTFVLGSIHAFSVFVEPWEMLLGASRADVSLTYSFALMALTASVLLGHRVFSLASPSVLALAICICAAAGAVIAAAAGTLFVLWVGYSLLFGGANGLGYGLALQIAAQAMPKRKGLAMGMVTASYAAGATVFSAVFRLVLDSGHLDNAMHLLAAVLLVVGAAVAICFRFSRARYRGEANGRPAQQQTGSPWAQFLLWAGYGTAAMAGLMAVGHAVGIVVSVGATLATATAGLVIVSFCNMIGAVTAGWMVDRVRVTSLMMALPLVSSGALLFLAAAPGVMWTLGALAVVGYCYGAVITLYPVAVAERFGADAAARIYGRVFTAWGLAGLAGPWTAGLLYDRDGDYSAATLLAAAVGLGSILCVRLLPAKPSIDVR
jgi:OFA family oxalate/formate antiporter-like MFS transporter